MIITNKSNLPQGIVRAVTTERHNKSPKHLSATTLLNGTKQVILTNRHWDELTDDVADRIWAIFGTAVHALLEEEGKDEFTEIDLEAQIGDMTITGRADNYNMATGVISDYKTASIWKVRTGDFEDWRQQGLIYAWLLKRNGFDVKQCRFIAILKDHSKSKANFDRSYPQAPVYMYEFPVTGKDLEATEQFIKDRLAVYQNYINQDDDAIPPCSDKERWASETKYAVMKTGVKRAVRLCVSQMEARDLAARLSSETGKPHFVETRPGVSRKCANYCLCREFCNFFKTIVQNQEQEEE